MFFNYTKKTKNAAWLVASIYACAFGVLLSVILSFAINYLLSDTDSNYIEIIPIISGIACFVIFEFTYLFSKKGVYTTEDKLTLKNGYKETGRNAFVNFSNEIYFRDILDVEFYDKYEPISTMQEKFIGKRVKDNSYVVLTIKAEPNNILLYLSVENEVEFCRLLERHIWIKYNLI